MKQMKEKRREAVFDPESGLPLTQSQNFNGRAVYLTGHAYKKCRFEQCTLIYQGAPSCVTECDFINCRWHIDVLAWDLSMWEDMQRSVFALIGTNLPRVTAPMNPPTLPASS